MATAAKAKTGAVAFGSRELYAAGGGLPEGDYVWKELTVQMYQAPPNQTTGKQAAARLGISSITLQIHRTNVMRKMAADSLADLVRMAGCLEVPLSDHRRAQ